MCHVEQLLCNVDILSTLSLIMIGYDLMCTFDILVDTSHLIMCTVGSICSIFEFTNKTFLYIAHFNFIFLHQCIHSTSKHVK